jgi:arginase
VVAGNCLASVGVMAGLCAAGASTMRTGGVGEVGRGGKGNKIGTLWFDAHDDYNIPDTVVCGHFDSRGIAVMTGESWEASMATVPGFRAVDLKRVIHVGMRDVNELERDRVNGSEMGVVWGGEGVDLVGGLEEELDKRLELESEVLVHLDLDVLDVSVGKANSFACGGGLSEEELRGCMRKIAERTVPLAFTAASFDPFCDSEESAKHVPAAAVDAVNVVVEGLRVKGLLKDSG